MKGMKVRKSIGIGPMRSFQELSMLFEEALALTFLQRHGNGVSRDSTITYTTLVARLDHGNKKLYNQRHCSGRELLYV